MAQRASCLSRCFAISVVGMIGLAAMHVTSTSAPAPAVAPVALVCADGDYATLSHVDSRSLKPVGTQIALAGSYAGVAGFSPDGTRLALTSGNPPNRIGIVDLRTMRRLRSLNLRSLETWPALLAWLAPHCLVSVSAYGRVLTIGPATGRTRGKPTRPVEDGTIAGAARFKWGAREAVVVVFGQPPPTRVVVVDSLGAVRVGTLAARGSGDASIAVDEQGRRAFVTAEGRQRRIAEIALASLRVWHRSPHPWVSATLRGETRLIWVGKARMAAFGHTAIDADADFWRPDGVRIVDTRTWRTRLLHAGANLAACQYGSCSP